MRSEVERYVWLVISVFVLVHPVVWYFAILCFYIPHDIELRHTILSCVFPKLFQLLPNQRIPLPSPVLDLVFSILPLRSVVEGTEAIQS
jgi:hypothetical protein